MAEKKDKVKKKPAAIDKNKRRTVFKEFKPEIHANAKEHECPYCGSESFGMFARSKQDEFISHTLQCHKCSGNWTALYQFAGIIKNNERV